MTQIFLVAPGAGAPGSVARFRPLAFRDALVAAGHAVELFITSNYRELPGLRHMLVQRAAAEKPSLVIISAGPFTWLPRMAFALKRSHIPFALDFRDGWSPNMLNRSSSQLFKYPVARAIERRLIQASPLFVTCTHGLQNYYRELADDASKVQLVLNGHSVPSSLSEMAQRRIPFSHSSVKLCVLGKFFYYDMQAAIRLLETVLRDAEHASLEIEIVVIGEPTINRIWQRLPVRLRSSMTIIPPVSYHEALKQATDCDAGIAYLRDPRFEYGTKIFDFVALGRPVISNASEASPAYRFFSPYLFTSLLDALHFHAPLEVPKKYSRSNNSQALVPLVAQCASPDFDS